MSFNGNEGTVISKEEGGALTKAYRDANAGEANLILAHFLGINKINQILTQPGCMGIRTYYGIDSTGKKSIVMVGVDANENDLVNGIVLDKATNCPPYCGSDNILNSNV